MKILCIADHIDPLIYSKSLRERFGDVDLVLSAGDLEMDYYGYIVSSLNKPLLFVFGNHNLSRIAYYRHEYRSFPSLAEKEEFIEKSYGSTYVGGKVLRRRGLIVAGLGGSMRYNKGRNQFTETGMFFHMLKLFPKMLYHRIFHGRWVDVLLTHAPPRGIGDRYDRCHRGFKTFLFFMKYFKPRYLVHGHVHLYDMNENRERIYHQTIVVNAYEHTLLNIEVS